MHHFMLGIGVCTWQEIVLFLADASRPGAQIFVLWVGFRFVLPVNKSTKNLVVPSRYILVFPFPS